MAKQKTYYRQILPGMQLFLKKKNEKELMNFCLLIEIHEKNDEECKVDWRTDQFYTALKWPKRNDHKAKSYEHLGQQIFNAHAVEFHSD